MSIKTNPIKPNFRPKNTRFCLAHFNTCAFARALVGIPSTPTVRSIPHDNRYLSSELGHNSPPIHTTADNIFALAAKNQLFLLFLILDKPKVR
jgi:hypothetical protein